MSEISERILGKANGLLEQAGLGRFVQPVFTAGHRFLPVILSMRAGLLPVLTLFLLVFMILPVPVMLLDLGFVANITIALAVLMVALNVQKPLDFSSFPTVLLFATLLRLALNVASTRIVLIQGHEGELAAGQIIAAFGKFLIGGDFIVGIFVFVILMIINLVVITKGAGRVSEVTARFTLDALPGKQIAIDADLNAGLLTADEAKARREEVATESDFYGAMDGASKFVKGDAVAGVLILVVNILGGITLGMVSHGLSIGDAAETYILLSIGDALVAQIPALLLSIAAAAIVTRVSSPLDLPGQISSQFGSARAWIPVAAILFILGLLPDMPHTLLIGASAICGGLSWYLYRRPEPVEETEEPEPAQKDVSIITPDEISDNAPLGLEIGYALVPLVDDGKGAPLMKRLTGIRRQLSKELGFVVPKVRVRDDMTLSPRAYRVSVGGITLAEEQASPDELLALDGGQVRKKVSGRETKDPTFGIDAIWIKPELRSEATLAGYNVVDAPTVVATHFNHLISHHAADVFGPDEARQLIDTLREAAPELVEGLTPQPLSLYQITAICRELLHEQIPISDFRRIAVAMVQSVNELSLQLGADKLPVLPLVEAVRRRIAPIIIQSLVPHNVELPCLTLAPELEELISKAVVNGGENEYPVDPGLSDRIVQSIEAVLRLPAIRKNGTRPALVTAPHNRIALRNILKPRFPELPILSFMEIPPQKAVNIIAVVGGPQADPSSPDSEGPVRLPQPSGAVNSQ